MLSILRPQARASQLTRREGCLTEERYEEKCIFTDLNIFQSGQFRVYMYVISREQVRKEEVEKGEVERGGWESKQGKKT